MSRMLLVAALTACGCAGPFEAMRGSVDRASVRVADCGTSGASGTTIVQTLDGPPTGETGSALPAPVEAVFCLSVENTGSAPVAVHRSQIRLRAPRETQSYVADRDEDHVKLAAGATAKLRVSFRYTPLRKGEVVEVRLDDAITRGDTPIAVPPLRYRKR
jgi:hypothetical protein